MTATKAGASDNMAPGVGVASAVGAGTAASNLGWQKDRIGGMARNVELVAYNDLDGKTGYQMGMQQVGGRWYLYCVHWWVSGISIIDVTDPANPQYIKYVPEPGGKPGTYMFKLQVADGIGITNLGPKSEQPLQDLFFGPLPDSSYDEGILIWDMKDPVNPKVISHWKSGGLGTHRNFYNGGRYVHLAASCPGFSGRIYRILDIIDPSKPIEVGRWFFPEQFQDAAKPGTVPNRTRLHGPPIVLNNKTYISYANVGMVILDISDITRPKYLGTLPTYPILGGREGGASVHTCLPLSQRPLAVVTSEGERPFALDPNRLKGKSQQLQFIGMVDVADPTDPKLISMFPKPVPPPGSAWGDDYSVLDGLNYPFGPHNLHESTGQPPLEDRNDRIYCTYFQAGLRIYDISNQFAPKEIAAYCPPDPKKWRWQRVGGFPGKLTMCTEDILVDKRGYIYFTNGQDGLYIARCTV